MFTTYTQLPFDTRLERLHLIRMSLLLLTLQLLNPSTLIRSADFSAVSLCVRFPGNNYLSAQLNARLSPDTILPLISEFACDNYKWRRTAALKNGKSRRLVFLTKGGGSFCDEMVARKLPSRRPGCGCDWEPTVVALFAEWLALWAQQVRDDWLFDRGGCSALGHSVPRRRGGQNLYRYIHAHWHWDAALGSISSALNSILPYSSGGDHVCSSYFYYMRALSQIWAHASYFSRSSTPIQFKQRDSPQQVVCFCICRGSRCFHYLHLQIFASLHNKVHRV